MPHTQPNIEIERKFLVKSLPCDIQLLTREHILQGYILLDPKGNEVRIRNKANKYYLTVKSSGGLTRQETEIELGETQYKALWPLTKGKRVEKTRYTVNYLNHRIEIDIYSGKLKGLIVAEVEFRNTDECTAFQLPDWFGAEVTEDARYKNKNLATLKSFETLETLT